MSTPVQFKTPKGPLEWVNIRGEGKENLSGKLQYVANVVVEADDPIIAQIEAYWEENKPKGFKKDPKSMGIYDHTVATDEQDENGKTIYEPDGKKVLAFKTGTTYADGKPKVVAVYNAAGKVVNVPELKVGNGSVGYISGAMAIYANKMKNKDTVIDAGVTLYLNAVQITKLVEFSTDHGFEAETDDPDAWGGDEWAGETEPDASNDTPKVKL